MSVQDVYKIYALDPTSGRLIGWISAPGEKTSDIAWQGKEYLWAVDEVDAIWEHAKVFKIEVSAPSKNK